MRVLTARLRRRVLEAIAAGGLATLLFAAGCGGGAEDGRMEVYPVSGTAMQNGQPATGAKVTLYGATDDLRGPGVPIPTGEVDETGEFVLTSYENGDGAPAGEYKVTVFWPEPIPPDADQEMFQPKDKLGEKYLTPDATTLTATVEEGGGELPPLEL